MIRAGLMYTKRWPVQGLISIYVDQGLISIYVHQGLMSIYVDHKYI